MNRDLMPTDESKTIRFPKTIGLDLMGAMDQLFEVFQDHYPYLVDEDSTHWTLGRHWPTNAAWYVDPHLPSQAKNLFNCELVDLPRFKRVESIGTIPILLSMFHSQALTAPVVALKQPSGRAIDCIVHVDAHDDLMSVPITSEGGSLYESLTGTKLNLDHLASIERAIDSGTVNKGNFLTAYLLGKAAGRLIHVFDSLQPAVLHLTPYPRRVPLGAESLAFTALRAVEEFKESAWILEEAALFPEVLDESTEGVWLDVDLDAFCNRYDGDSDRRNIPATPEERAAMDRGVREFLSALESANWLSRIQVVSIACSPGFFPSEYWDDVLPRVHGGICAILRGKGP